MSYRYRYQNTTSGALFLCTLEARLLASGIHDIFCYSCQYAALFTIDADLKVYHKIEKCDEAHNVHGKERGIISEMYQLVIVMPRALSAALL